MIFDFVKFNESKSKFPNIKEAIIDGFKVLVGRDSESNDYLTTKIADPDDLWMHAKGVPGSHVVVRIKDRIPTLENIQEFAKLAIKNSKFKTEGVVVYCKSKFVRKDKSMKIGQVSVDYINSSEIKIKI